MMIRTRADVLAELADWRHLAGRMTCVDPDYAKTHREIDALLDELEGLS